jgi:hypothetical protein
LATKRHLETMPTWLGYVLALAALLATAPIFAWLGRKHGRSIKGSAGLALVMLGFGAMFDPPKKALIEAVQGEEEGSQESGEHKGCDPDDG